MPARPGRNRAAPSSRGPAATARISVSQPETTSQASGGYSRSIEPSLGPFGDPFGLRPVLKEKGIEYSVTYVADVLGNPVGGVRRGAAVEDRLNLRLNLDLERLAGWEGATIHANAYFIHGTGLSRYYVGNLLPVSVIEALPSSRLYVLWLDQQLFDNTLGLRIGQQAADTEFFVSQTATLFVNSTFGWPAITGLDLPSGGPAYPLATPAIRAKYVPGNGFSLQVGLYDGDPAGASRPGDDPEAQRLNRTGTNFRLGDPALVVAEATYAYNTEAGSRELPGTSPSAAGSISAGSIPCARTSPGCRSPIPTPPASAARCAAMRGSTSSTTRPSTGKPARTTRASASSCAPPTRPPGRAS